MGEAKRNERMNDTLVQSDEARTSDNFYATPTVCTEAAVREFKLPKKVWEPACGEGDLARVLEAAGVTVVATDLNYRGFGDPTPIDFLMETKAPPGCSVIITNPPFNLADQFIRKSLELAPRAIMFLRAAYLEGTSRSDLLDNHLRRVVMGADRPPMMHREGYEGPKMKQSRAAFGWFEFTRKPTRGVIEVRRIRWQQPTAAKPKRGRKAHADQLDLFPVANAEN